MFPTHASCFKGCKIASGDQPTRLVAPASLTQWFPVVFGAQMAVLAAAEALGWFLIGPFLESAPNRDLTKNQKKEIASAI